MDARAVHGFDVEADQPVVQQQHRAGRDVLRQFLVVEADARGVAVFALGIQDEGLPGLEADPAVGELADADLGALQVGHDGNLAAQLPRAFADAPGVLDVVRGTAVREIEADDIHARGEHSLQHVRVAACRTEGRDDLGVAWHG